MIGNVSLHARKVSSIKRPPPSWLWSIPVETRREQLAKKDSAGQIVWKLEKLSDDQTLGRPKASADLTETAHMLLMAELHEHAVTEECDMCGRQLAAARTKQVCEECHGRSEKAVKS